MTTVDPRLPLGAPAAKPRPVAQAAAAAAPADRPGVAQDELAMGPRRAAGVRGLPGAAKPAAEPTPYEQRQARARQLEEQAIREGAHDPNLRRVEPAKIAAFRADVKAKGEELALRLREDPQLQEAEASWADLDVKQRLAVGKRVADHMGEVFGFTPSYMAAVGDKASEGADATYDDATGTITLNHTIFGPEAAEKADPTKARDKLRDFTDAIVHEQFHRYQHVVRTTSYKPDDPRQHAGGVYRWNDPEPAYKPAPDDEAKSEKTLQQYERYLRQPVENDAWVFARGVADATFGPRGTPAPRRACSCSNHG